MIADWPTKARVPAAFALAVLSGLLFVAATPPAGIWPLAFVAWAPLLVAFRGRSPRHALWIGAVQGFTVDLLGARWLTDVARTFVDRSWVLCWALALAVHAYGAGRSAILGWLFARSQQRGWPPGVAFVLGFAATEALYPLLFPWYAGVAVHRAPIFMQLAEIGGPVLVGIPIAMSSVALAEIAQARMERRPIDRARVALGLLGPAASAAFGVVRIASIDRRIAEAPQARVGIVQGNVPHTGASLARSLVIHRDATAALEAQGPLDLVVWPETALSGVAPEDGVAAMLASVAAGRDGHPPLHAPIITGAILRREAPAPAPGTPRREPWSNSAVLFADGAIRGVYDKMHPLMFGEYIPFGDVLPKLYEWIPNAGRVKRGERAVALPLGEHRILPLICYEDILGASANDAVGQVDPDLLVNLTNDAWFGRSDAAAVHLALAQFRAVEHRRYLVRATNSGVSAFVDPAGRATDLTPMMEPAIRAQTVRWMRAHTIYETLGETPWVCVGLVVAAMAFVRRPVGAKVVGILEGAAPRDSLLSRRGACARRPIADKLARHERVG